MAFAQAVISLYPKSGAIILRNLFKKPIVYMNGLGGYDREISRGDGHGPAYVLYQQENRLMLGKFEFVLALNVPSRVAERESFVQRRNAMILEGGSYPFDSNALPLPVDALEIIVDVAIYKRIIEHWSYGVCFQSGQPLALLRQTCDSKSQDYVKEMVDKLSRLEDVPGVWPSVITFCEHSYWPLY